MKNSILYILLFFFPIAMLAQNSVLDNYIKEGLESNLAIKQRNLSLENAIYALKSARRNYIPTLNFEGIYTTAEGGRSYEIPVGDYLNPLLNTVNQFLSTPIPNLDNEKINFLPKDYYDAKVRLAVPILNMDIIHNNEIRQQQAKLSENDVIIFERELVKEIKITYYNYLSAKKAVEIYQNVIDLAEESKRMNERLMEAGKSVYAYTLRAETEIEQAKTKLKNAEYQAHSVQLYFNALLNRESNENIVIEESVQNIPLIDRNEVSVANREEMTSLENLISLRESILKMNKQTFIPKLSGFADAGAQAEKMRFNKEALYYMVGLQLTFPIFNGTKNNLAIKVAKNDIEIAKYQKQEIEQKLNLSVQVAYNNVLTEQANYEAALKQLELAETYHRLINKGYDSGINTYIETVDARTQLSSAKIATNVSYYQLLIAQAKLERETASYSLPNKN
ncbi:MAG: TolC family protein [Brumimicrobium sp.]|nr:TolC family protein [Brumimicrobium sp.]MCO5269245.1 TolC family protein [Brumimicrobium sp.]